MTQVVVFRRRGPSAIGVQCRSLCLAKIPSAASDAESRAYRNWFGPELATVGQAAHAPTMRLVLKLLLWSIRSLTLSRRALVLENLAVNRHPTLTPIGVQC